eukprot:Lankesteria_metandrocarpae@DN4237_c1_g2_i1.p1
MRTRSLLGDDSCAATAPQHAAVSTPQRKKKLNRWANATTATRAHPISTRSSARPKRAHSSPGTPTHKDDEDSSDDDFEIGSIDSSSSSISSGAKVSTGGMHTTGSSEYASAVVALAELSADWSPLASPPSRTPRTTSSSRRATTAAACSTKTRSTLRADHTQSSSAMRTATPPRMLHSAGTPAIPPPRPTPQRKARRRGSEYRVGDGVASAVGRGESSTAWVLQNSPLRTSTTTSLHALRLTTELDELPCREEHLGKVVQYLEGVLVSKSGGGCLYVSGMPGTGKTATVCAAIRKVARKLQKPFDVVEVNAIRVPSPNAVFQVIYRALYKGRAPSPEKAYRVLDRRFHTADPLRPFCILVVDEVDALVTKKQNVLYTIFDWPTIATSKLGVIAIANTMDLLERMMPRCASRLGFGRLDFYPYSRDQLVIIVTHRLNEANKTLARDGQRLEIDSSAIEMCARKVASLSGDLRRALQICRIALQSANRHEDRKVKLQDIVMAAKQMHQSTSEEVIATLPLIQKIFLLAVVSELRMATALGMDSGGVPLYKVVDRLRNEVNNIGFYGPKGELMASQCSAVLCKLVDFNLVSAFVDSHNKENVFRGHKTAAYCDDECGAWVVTLVPLIEEVQSGLCADEYCRKSLQKLNAAGGANRK